MVGTQDVLIFFLSWAIIVPNIVPNIVLVRWEHNRYSISVYQITRLSRGVLSGMCSVFHLCVFLCVVYEMCALWVWSVCSVSVCTTCAGYVGTNVHGMLLCMCTWEWL